jgi:hypothetical protein
MAVKKTTTKQDESAAPTTVQAKETAPRKTKAAAPKQAAPQKGAAPKKAAPAPIRLSTSQGELLKKIGGATETGYSVEKKVEQRSVDSLLEKKLIKKGAKDKATGSMRYHISSAGKKHIS